MKVIVKVGRKEGFVSSYNLFLPDLTAPGQTLPGQSAPMDGYKLGTLRLRTDDLTFASSDGRAIIRAQFIALLDALRQAGWTVEGEA